MRITFPNVERLLAQGLQAFLADHGHTMPVGGRKPEPLPHTYILLWVSGGGRRDQVTDQPLIIVETWSTTDEQACAMADLVRAYINGLEGDTLGGHPIYAVSEAARPANLPDSTGRSRYTATYQLDLRGTRLQ